VRAEFRAAYIDVLALLAVSVLPCVCYGSASCDAWEAPLLSRIRPTSVLTSSEQELRVKRV